MLEMKEYFIRANSFAAPFFSDSSSAFEKAETVEDALNNFARKYKNPYRSTAFLSCCKVNRIKIIPNSVVNKLIREDDLRAN